jgi:hypothetical protein
VPTSEERYAEESVIGSERLAQIGKQAFQNLAGNGLLGTAMNTARNYEEDRAKLRRILPSDPAYDGVCVWMSLRYPKGYPLARATTIAVELASAGLTPAQMTVDGAISKVVEQHELLYGAYCANSRETIITTARDWATRYVRAHAPRPGVYDWDRDGL